MILQEQVAKHNLTPKMSFVANESDITWFIDPKQQFTEADPLDIANGLGLIPNFIFDVTDVISEALKQYGFGGSPMEGTKVEEGMYVSPFKEDPIMAPYGGCYCEKADMWVFVYAYGIIAFVTDDKTVAYRFD